jgi:putative photosynthetic complex assembly protein 2
MDGESRPFKDGGMTSIAGPVLFCLFVWWFSTGVILYLDGLPRRTFRWSLMAASALAAVALYGIAISSSDDSARGAYVAFTCALALWGWHEMTFLMGLLTGPRRSACPAGATGWLRLRYAIETIAYHELAIAGTALLLAAITANGSNRLGLWTFLLLWFMRISAKINVFLGVPNLSEDWLPNDLLFLQSYFRKAPMNMFFPLAVTAATIATVLLAQAAFSPALTPAGSTGLMLLAVLMGLAVLEHWFLVLPFPFAAIWAWGLGSRELVAMKPLVENPLPGHTKHSSGLVSGPANKRARAA